MCDFRLSEPMQPATPAPNKGWTGCSFVLPSGAILATDQKQLAQVRARPKLLLASCGMDCFEGLDGDTPYIESPGGGVFVSVLSMKIFWDLLRRANNVLLKKKVWAGDWYTIHHHLAVVNRLQASPSTNQPTNWKRTSMVEESHMRRPCWMLLVYLPSFTQLSRLFPFQSP